MANVERRRWQKKPVLVKQRDNEDHIKEFGRLRAATMEEIASYSAYERAPAFTDVLCTLVFPDPGDGKCRLVFPMTQSGFQAAVNNEDCLELLFSLYETRAVRGVFVIPSECPS